MKQEEINFLIEFTKSVAKRSKAIRAKVGAVAVDSKGDIICYGYNGTVYGVDNTCETRVYTDIEEPNYPLYMDWEKDATYKLVTNESSVIHAEQNIICHAARRGISLDSGTVFVTHSPCAKCTSLMIQSGIKDVFYSQPHRTFNDVHKEYSKFINLIEWYKK